jgi:hypothetical protein
LTEKVLLGVLIEAERIPALRVGSEFTFRALRSGASNNPHLVAVTVTSIDDGEAVKVFAFQLHRFAKVNSE